MISKKGKTLQGVEFEIQTWIGNAMPVKLKLRIFENYLGVFLKPLQFVSLIPNGRLDAYEVKENIDIFKYQEKVELISIPEIFYIFQWLMRV